MEGGDGDGSGSRWRRCGDAAGSGGAGVVVLKIENRAPDRTGSGNAGASPAPPWLEGAVPRQGIWSFVCLYPRGVGETVVLHVGEFPLVAAWRPGGKVVMCAPTNVSRPVGLDVPALARAVLKDTGGVRLRAWREGDGVVAEASGSDGAPFAFDGEAAPSRPVGPGRSRATLPLAPAREILVSCGAATVLLAARSGELVGLANRPDIAAAIAASSGGVLGEEPPASARATAVWLTLLAAACLVLLSAWRRRKA